MLWPAGTDEQRCVCSQIDEVPAHEEAHPPSRRAVWIMDNIKQGPCFSNFILLHASRDSRLRPVLRIGLPRPGPPTGKQREASTLR
eukprot:9312932-Pyramimonas_sp.AAC.1